MATSYQVIARKYRPQNFSDVVGQEAVITTLLHALRMDRVAHAYLFSGSRGTGKTTLARLFAKALNCHAPSNHEPCNACSSCQEIAASSALDVLEIDGASHRGIEDIRQINETIGFAPTSGHFKIYIIDEVHMLTKEAFNALLKTLEEPPPSVKFFFATTEPHKIPPTILSRCQRFNLGRIPAEKIEHKLSRIARDMGAQVDPQALALIAERAQGGLRDAESLLDQVLAFDASRITPETVSEVLGLVPRTLFATLDKAATDGHYTAAFDIAEQVFSSGRHCGHFIEELINHYRSLLLKQSHPPYSSSQLLDILELLSSGLEQIKHTSSPKITLEMLLLRLLRIPKRLPLETLVSRLESMGSSVTEDPVPKPSELPPPKKPPQKSETHHPSRYDTLLQFAAQELGGTLKKE